MCLSVDHMFISQFRHCACVRDKCAFMKEWRLIASTVYHSFSRFLSLRGWLPPNRHNTSDLNFLFHLYLMCSHISVCASYLLFCLCVSFIIFVFTFLPLCLLGHVYVCGSLIVWSSLLYKQWKYIFKNPGVDETSIACTDTYQKHGNLSCTIHNVKKLV